MRGLHMGRMARSGARLLAATALALALGAVEARADHIFTLSGVTFDDGGTATGMFTTNDALNSLVSYDILTSGGTLTGFDYTPATTTSFSSLPSILVLETTGLEHLIQLTFTGLTVAGAPIKIGQFDSFEQDPTGTHRQVVSGEVVGLAAVPEPASLLMGGIAALAGLGMWARRRLAG
jgi:hypothetical protein